MAKVVFACIHNAGRSQMAAALFNELADPTLAHAVSAGTQPADRVHASVVSVMKEAGIDLQGRRPQLLTPDLVGDATLLVTMGCGDECPYVPGLAVDDWPLPDPKDLPLPEVREIREAIRNQVTTLLKSRGWERPHER
jgi:protein-tyrosine-phosphatase